MTDRALEPLLTSVLSVARGSPFVVLRNADGLPGQLTGRDVDVSLHPGTTVRHALDFVCQRAQALGWQIVVASRRHHMAAVTVFHGETRRALHFDLFRGITHLSIPLFSPGELWQESEVVDDVRRLTPRMEVLATTVHRVVFGGTLNKQKYMNQLNTLLRDPAQRRWMEKRVKRVLGATLAGELTDPGTLDALAGGGVERARRARRSFLGIRLRANPLGAVADAARYGFGQLDSVVSPPGVVGLEGDRFPGLPGEALTLELASALSAYGYQIEHARADAASLKTLNAPRFADMLRQRWEYWSVLRRIAPSAFLWLQAKRAGIVIVERLPALLRVLRRSPFRPRWLTRSGT